MLADLVGKQLHMLADLVGKQLHMLADLVGKQLHMFISIADLLELSLYGSEKNEGISKLFLETGKCLD